MLIERGDPKTEAMLRTRNLMWTVSGDYSLDTKTDTDSFEVSKAISMYDAIKQGAFARFYDQDAFGMYIIKKIYAGADDAQLTELAQLCVDAAIASKIARERPGVPDIRKKAFCDLLDFSYESMSRTKPGRLKIAFLKEELTGDSAFEKETLEALDKIRALHNAKDVLDIIQTTDWLYNTLIDRGFEKQHGDLNAILSITVEDLKEFDWRDYLEEEGSEELLDTYFQKMSQDIFSIKEEPDEKQRRKKAKRRVVVIDEAAAKKMYSYIELNFGRSYLTKEEQKREDARLCTGAHADCRLYFTDGILENPVIKNAQYVSAKRSGEKNRVYFKNHAHLIGSSVKELSQEIARSLNIRSEPEFMLSDSGRILPTRLWQIGRKKDPEHLFEKTVQRSHSDFAVEILIDGSGSQRDRQREVALQAFIIAEALSRNSIPLEITGFCTFWDYTILQRFRSYDAPISENRRLLNFTATANNRDGLAIRAAGSSLLKRPEDGKILIVLSDGKPNDIIVNRPDSKNPQTYAGKYAVMDTAREVRRLRQNGVYVLGIFTGKEEDLFAERTIFGRDFTYIPRISGFARVVANYLRRLLEDSADF